MDEKQVGVARLPLPEDTKKRGLIVSQIQGIRGLTTPEKEALISAYEEIQQRGKVEAV